MSLAGLLLAIGMYAYLGSFSRYIADDYCDTVTFQNKSVIEGVLDRYSEGAWRAAGRYTSIFLIGLGELVFPANVQVIVSGMVLLWTLSLIFLLQEFRRALGLSYSSFFDFYFGLLIAFFSLFLAPNLFQSVYWRASMMNHFAPLVFGAFLLAFILRQARQSKSLSLFFYAFTLFVFFVFAGFSEPPTTTMLILLPLIFIWFWFRSSSQQRTHLIALFGSAFAGVMIGFMVMFFSPAVSNAVDSQQTNLLAVFLNSFLYAFQFIVDSLSRFRLPFALLFLLPFLLIWLWKNLKQVPQSFFWQGKQKWLILLVPFLLWILVAAGFAPSAYGQGFPVERMRFLAQIFIIVSVMTVGGWFGWQMPSLRFGWQAWIGLGIFGFVSIAYPVRAAYNLTQNPLPEYSQHAKLWDMRNEYILKKVDQGINDVVVPGISGFNGVKEVDGNPAHWINVCAAQFYGVTTIEAVSVEEEYFLEMLSD